MNMRDLAPRSQFFSGPLHLAKRSTWRHIANHFTHVAKYGSTEPIECLVALMLLAVGVLMARNGSPYFQNTEAWSAGYIITSLWMTGAMVTGDRAARMWGGLFCFVCRIWMIGPAYAHEDAQWGSAMVGAIAGAWLFLRYLWEIVHSPVTSFCGVDCRCKRRRYSDHVLDVVGDICAPGRN